VRFFVNTFPLPVQMLIVVGVFISGAVVGRRIVHRRLPMAATEEDNDLSAVLLGFVSLLYGIVLGFVIVALWGDFQSAEQTVSAEAADVAQLYRDAQVLDATTASAMHDAVDSYLHHVTGPEWQRMRDGGAAVEAGVDLNRMFDVLSQARPEGTVQETFYSAAVNELNSLVGARRERLFRASHELPAGLEVLLFGGGVINLAFLFVFGAKHPRLHEAMVAAVSAMLGFSLFLVVALDHPYAGRIAVSDAPFRQGALAPFFEK
jgi:hypothetical protein